MDKQRRGARAAKSGGLLRLLGGVSAIGTTAVAVLLLVFVSSAVASTDFSWSGSGTSSADWSQADNWSGDVSPTGQIGSLSFGDLGGGCVTAPAASACYRSVDDLGDLTVGNITIDDSAGYAVSSSNSGIDLNPFSEDGIDATASGAGSASPAQIDVPIFVVDQQLWRIDGGGHLGAGVYTPTVSGNSGVTAELTNGATLYLSQLNVGVALRASGDGSGFIALTGSQAVINWVGGLDLNNGTGFIDLSPAAYTPPINLDAPAGTKRYLFAVGGGSSPDGTLNVGGTQEFGSSVTLRFDIDDNGGIPSADYSKLAAAGSVAFGGAAITLDQGTTSSGGCATLLPGESYTLISSVDPLTGNIAYVDTQGSTRTLTEGQTSAPIPLAACAADSTSVASEAILTYSTNTITAMVAGAPVNVMRPSISGTAAVGQTLTAYNGDWNAGPPPTYAYQWMVCRIGCTSIPGATDSTLQVTSADVGDYVELRVTATNSLGSTGALSRGTPVVAAPASQSPTTQQPTPSTNQIRAALRAIAIPSGKKAIAALLRSRSFKTSFRAPSGGVLTIKWTTNIATGRGSHERHRKVTLAMGSARATISGRIRVTIKLTSRGRALIQERPTGLSASAGETFAPSTGNGAHSLTAIKKLRL